MGIIGSSAGELAAAVRSGELDPSDVVDAHLERIEQHASLGAFQLVVADRARAAAKALRDRDDLADLPLAGVPIAIKDNVDVAGLPTRNGSAATSGDPLDREDLFVTRLVDAGAIIVGKTQVPELCIFGDTDSVLGTAHNPWNRDRTPGGSSGGSAAAVAAALVPLATGNDGMGSIRIPAACCGLVGIKPGLGVVPSHQGTSEGWFQMSEDGPLATTVADAALALDLMAGGAGVRELDAPARLRIGVSALNPAPLGSVDAEFVSAVTAIGDTLADLGHEVVTADPPYDPLAVAAATARWTAGAARDANGLDPRQLTSRTRAHVRTGRVALRLGRVREHDVDRWRAKTAEFFRDIDVLITPALARTPKAASGWTTTAWPMAVKADMDHAPFAAPWNLARYPAMAVPAGMHTDGLPLSVQLVAPDGGERLLLGVAAQIESAMPWPRHAPMVEQV